MRDIQALNILQARHAIGQDTCECVAAGIKDCYIAKHPDFCWEATTKAIVREDNLVQVHHLANAVWNATSEFVVCKCHNRNSGFAYCLWDGRCEPVVVQEQCIQILLKEFWWQCTFELIVSDIKVLEAGPGYSNGWEATNKAVVADIKLMHKCEPRQALGNDSTKPVRVDVE